MRLTYDRAAKAVTHRSDTSEGPTAGTETADPLEFLARLFVHTPEKGHVTTRYSGLYANRPCGMRGPVESAGVPREIMPAPCLAPSEATRRWVALLQQIFEVDPLACPTCRGPMRIIAFITQASVIDQILAHRHTRGPRRREESARDPRTVWTGRHATTRRGPPGPVSLTPMPRRRAATFGVCVRPTGRPIGPRGDQAPTRNNVQTANEARGRAAAG